jgi:hypothetical protein
VAVPNGGPAVWPVPSNAQQIAVPIPTSSTSISFSWEYFNAEGVGSSFNDGFAVAVVTSTGSLVSQLVYADNQVATGSCTDSLTFATEVSPTGAQSFSAALPPLSGCEYLAIQAWNGGDNAVAGVGYIDNIVFNSSLGGCAVPVFAPPTPPFPTLSISAPSGPGCIQADLMGLPPGGSYFLAVTLNAGAFPGGWFFGIDIGGTELASELLSGFPFSGSLSSAGTCSAGGTATIGQFCGAPSGLTVYAVGLGNTGVGLSGPFTAVTNAASFTIP